ncbi:hypothetical protein IT417_02125 [bacterium]|nr:hypothetical protein [bacterium]
MDVNSVVSSVLESKKYRDLSEDLVRNVTVTLSYKYSDKELLDKTKAKLHQIWGAYYSSRPDFKKLFGKFLGKKIELADIVKIHSSTKERALDCEKVLSFVTENTEVSRRVLDIGCGLNPILMMITSLQFDDYICFDIDTSQQHFLNEIFKSEGKTNMKAIVCDALMYDFPRAELAILFKLLPVLNQIDSKKCDEFLNKLEVNYLVVSFPNRSLSGKEKGMRENYKIYVEKVSKCGYALIANREFSNETVYIFKKQNRAM